MSRWKYTSDRVGPYIDHGGKFVRVADAVALLDALEQAAHNVVRRYPDADVPWATSTFALPTAEQLAVLETILKRMEEQHGPEAHS